MPHGDGFTLFSRFCLTLCHSPPKFKFTNRPPRRSLYAPDCSLLLPSWFNWTWDWVKYLQVQIQQSEEVEGHTRPRSTPSVIASMSQSSHKLACSNCNNWARACVCRVQGNALFMAPISYYHQPTASDNDNSSQSNFASGSRSSSSPIPLAQGHSNRTSYTSRTCELFAMEGFLQRLTRWIIVDDQVITLFSERFAMLILSWLVN